MGDFGDTSGKVIIVGGGFGALSAAVALHKVGIPSIVLERSPQLRQEGFAIGTNTNAWRALQELGVDEEMRKDTISLQGFRFTGPQGELIKDVFVRDCPPPAGKTSHEIRCILREAFPRALTAQLPPGTVHYGVTVTAASVTASGAEVELEGGQKLEGRLVVLADGVHSNTAAAFHKAPLQYMDVTAWRGMTEIEGLEPTNPMATLAQHKGTRTGLIPMRYDRERRMMTYYWFLAVPGSEKDNFGPPETQKEYMQGRVSGWKKGIFHEVLDKTPMSNLRCSQIYQRRVVAGKPWFEGCLTAVGDAAHATTPYLGQGGAMALEDGVELGVAMKKAMKAGGVPFAQLPPDAIAAALREYEILRSHRVAHIIDKSRNFGGLFLVDSAIVSWILRRIMPFVIQPSSLFSHAVWEPSGSLSMEDGSPGSSKADKHLPEK